MTFGYLWTLLAVCVEQLILGHAYDEYSDLLRKFVKLTTPDGKVFGPDILQEAGKQVRMVRENLRVVQSRQKSYADHRRRELSFEVGDFVYLKVSPMRGLSRFKVRGKLTPRFIGPFNVLEKRGEVAYLLDHSFLMCMTCSMSLNWRSVCECLKSKYPWKSLMTRKIFLTKSILSRF
jgi:hypothetical protein